MLEAFLVLLALWLVCTEIGRALLKVAWAIVLRAIGAVLVVLVVLALL